MSGQVSSWVEGFSGGGGAETRSVGADGAGRIMLGDDGWTCQKGLRVSTWMGFRLPCS